MAFHLKWDPVYVSLILPGSEGSGVSIRRHANINFVDDDLVLYDAGVFPLLNLLLNIFLSRSRGFHLGLHFVGKECSSLFLRDELSQFVRLGLRIFVGQRVESNAPAIAACLVDIRAADLAIWNVNVVIIPLIHFDL